MAETSLLGFVTSGVQRTNQRLPGLVGLFGGGFANGAWARRAGQGFPSRVLALTRKRHVLSFQPLGLGGCYTSITSIPFLRSSPVKSCAARLSVIKRRILSKGPIFETLLRPNLLKSVTTLTSFAERIITLLSCASSTSGVESPFSRSKPSTARKRRSAWNSFIMASACGPTKEQETGRSSPPIIIKVIPGISANSTAIFKALLITVSDCILILGKWRATATVVVPESRMMVSAGLTKSAPALPILIFSSLCRASLVQRG